MAHAKQKSEDVHARDAVSGRGRSLVSPSNIAPNENLVLACSMLASAAGAMPLAFSDAYVAD